MLDKFITAKKVAGESVWFATQAGIFQGKISRDDFGHDEIVKLNEAFFITGNIRLVVGDISIIRETIVAWGTKNPALQNGYLD